MLRTVLWISAACAAVLLALAVSRFMDFDEPVQVTPPATVEMAPAATPPEIAPPPPPPIEAKPPPTPEDVQVLDDAAATGMTTVEPDPAPPVDTPPI